MKSILLLQWSLVLLCLSAPAKGAEMPPWLQDSSRPAESPGARSAEQAPVSPQNSGSDREPGDANAGTPSGWQGGPYIEEWVITPGVERQEETVAQRQARRGNDAVPVPPTPEIEADRYAVQPSDVLAVSVWREPDLQREVTVSPDGWISYPLVGDLYVENQTLEQIRISLESALRRYVNAAAVHVNLKFAAGNRVYVMGKVNNPGVFPFAKNLDVMQALSLAGGVARFASLDDIRVLRRENGEQIAYRFNYAKVRKGRALDQNILLRSGDVVMVP